ncbi:MAG: glycosyltransferase [Gemmatimonadales bacterium]
MKLAIQNMSHVWGGNEKWLSILAAGLVSRGHEVVVSCPDGPVREGLGSIGIRTSGFRPRGAIDPVSGLSFAWWLRRERPDAVLMTSWHSVVWTVFAARTARVRRIVLRQGIVRQFPRRGARAYALRHGVDAVIVNSEEVREVWLSSAGDFSADRLHVVLNGIASRKEQRENLRNRLRRELLLDYSTFLIGGAGHLFKRKGFDNLLRGFARAGVPDSVLAIAGKGEHRAELEELAGSLGIAEKVRWLGHRTDGPEVIAALDLFVLSSHNEGMANVMLEAMAGGVPVIACDISGVRRALGASADRSFAGWIVPPANDAALGASIADVASIVRTGNHDAQRRVDEAHWRIENWFSADRMVDECERILFRSDD